MKGVAAVRTHFSDVRYFVSTFWTCFECHAFSFCAADLWVPVPPLFRICRHPTPGLLRWSLPVGNAKSSLARAATWLSSNAPARSGKVKSVTEIQKSSEYSDAWMVLSKWEASMK
jgi:hypothetical protein